MEREGRRMKYTRDVSAVMTMGELVVKYCTTAEHKSGAKPIKARSE
jgi:hypothetical protein